MKKLGKSEKMEGKYWIIKRKYGEVPSDLKLYKIVF